MNYFFQNIISATIKYWLVKRNKQIEDEKLLDKVEIIKVNFKHGVRDTLFILVGIVAAGFGLKGFLLPNLFIDGGAMGISLLISETTDVPLSILIVAINFPFM